MKANKKYFMVIALLLIAITSGGCYWNRPVEEFERGLRLAEGVRIEKVLPPGRYNGGGWFTELETVNVSALTAQWSDESLVTKDKQPISLSLSITFSRKSDEDSIKSMWSEYNYEAISDEALTALVLTRVPRVAKGVTAKYTLDSMLGIDDSGTINEEIGREIVQQAMSNALERELAEFFVVLRDVGVNNIGPEPGYMELLVKKANSKVEREVAIEQALTAEENLKKEEKQTAINVELARRERLVEEESAEVYDNSPELYELERIRLMAEMFGQNDKVWFIPQGTDITLLLGEDGNKVVPLEP